MESKRETTISYKGHDNLARKLKVLRWKTTVTKKEVQLNGKIQNQHLKKLTTFLYYWHQCFSKCKCGGGNHIPNSNRN